jgi:hypothetical protein
LSSLVTVPPSSRASPLPQGFRDWREILLQHLLASTGLVELWFPFEK